MGQISIFTIYTLFNVQNFITYPLPNFKGTENVEGRKKIKREMDISNLFHRDIAEMKSDNSKSIEN